LKFIIRNRKIGGVGEKISIKKENESWIFLLNPIAQKSGKAVTGKRTNRKKKGDIEMQTTVWGGKLHVDEDYSECQEVGGRRMSLKEAYHVRKFEVMRKRGKERGTCTYQVLSFSPNGKGDLSHKRIRTEGSFVGLVEAAWEEPERIKPT